MAPADSGSLGVIASAPPRAATRLTLHLGVLMQPYRNGGVTTADVAVWLERRYGVMGVFFKIHEGEVVADVGNSLAGAMETMIMRGRPIGDPWAGAMQRIQQRFRDFISTRESERVGIPRTPAKAAERGRQPSPEASVLTAQSSPAELPGHRAIHGRLPRLGRLTWD
jgi:hypothetical protein